MSETPEKDEKEAAPTAPVPAQGGQKAAPDEPAKADTSAAPSADEAETDEAAEGGGDEEGATPEAIARRVAAFGEEDESERIAREEEQKLAARRAKMKRGKKGGGLEAAASKRLAKIAEKAQPKKMIATAVDGADPLLNQTAKLSQWAKKNQKGVAAVVAAAVVAGGIFGGYTYFQQKKDGEASAELSLAVADERGRIGDPDKEDDTLGPKDPRPVFKTPEERRDSALKKLKDVEARFPGTGAAILARLSEGSLDLDAKKKPDDAIAAYTDVRNSPLAAADAEVRGRALEGLGFAYELKGNLDDALKTFRELENTVDVLGFKELGMYHQARVYEAKGDKDKAKELLKTVHERMNKPGENYPFPYLKEVVDDRLRALDPTALPPKPSGMIGGPGGPKMNDEQIRKLIEQLQKQQGGHGAGGK